MLFLQIPFLWYLANSIHLECCAPVGYDTVGVLFISGLMSQNTTNDPVGVSGLYTGAVMHGYDVTLLCALVARQNTLNVIKSLKKWDCNYARYQIVVWCTSVRPQKFLIISCIQRERMKSCKDLKIKTLIKRVQCNNAVFITQWPLSPITRKYHSSGLDKKSSLRITCLCSIEIWWQSIPKDF